MFFNLFKWLLAWKEIPGDCRKSREETFTALWNTCYGLLAVVDYCLSKLGLNYVLSGKFQTDCLDHVLVNTVNFLVKFLYKFLEVTKNFACFLL